MVANYPYFGFPNYMRYVNSGIKNPTMVQGVPGFNMPPNGISPLITASLQGVPGFNMPPNASYIPSKRSQKQRSNSQAFNFQRRNPSFSGGQKKKSNISTFSPRTQKEKCQSSDSPIFNLLGINLYFDDILLILVIFFLYTEHVDDPYLFITLILLLLT